MGISWKMWKLFPKKEAHRRQRHKSCRNIRRFVNTIHTTWQRSVNSRLRFLSSWKWNSTSFSSTLRTAGRTRGAMNPKFPCQGGRGQKWDGSGECHWRVPCGKFSSEYSPGIFLPQRAMLTNVEYVIQRVCLKSALGSWLWFTLTWLIINAHEQVYLSADEFYKTFFFSECFTNALKESYSIPCFMAHDSSNLSSSTVQVAWDSDRHVLGTQ